MSICAFDIKLKGKKNLGTICALLFLLLSIVVYIGNVTASAIPFILGGMACIAVILLVANDEDKFGKSMDFLAMYTMPIFLLHTLCAASLRAVLLKIGVTNAVAHVVLGLGISFAGPIMVERIMRKAKWLDFFLYPNKFLRKEV